MKQFYSSDLLAYWATSLADWGTQEAPGNKCPTRTEVSQHNLSRFVYIRKFVSESTGRSIAEGIGKESPMDTFLYRTIILPVVLYGCETWSLTLREERRLRVFENRVFEESIWT